MSAAPGVAGSGDLMYGETLYFHGMPEAYPVLRDAVLVNGHRVAPRGEPTTELLGASFVIEDAVGRGVPVGTGRRVGRKMMAIDGAGNLAGRAYPDVSITLAPVLDRFADDLVAGDPRLTGAIVRDSGVQTWRKEVPPPGHVLGRFHQGVYGPRIGDQLEAVERQLRRDADTRQAVVSLWREEDREPTWRDRPCTTEFQLMVRGGALEVFVFMRANDLWTGTCYDVFQFGQVQAAMANVLGLPAGPYHHYATSLHVYDRDVERFAEVRPWSHVREGGGVRHVPAVENPRETFGPDWSAVEPGHYRSWGHVRDRFQELLNWCRVALAAPDEYRAAERTFEPANAVEQWYWDEFAAVREGAEK